MIITGQDRKSYSDTQDRDSYTVDPNLEKEGADISGEFPALTYFDASVEREKDARRAKGMSDTLDADTLRLLRESAERLFRHNG